MNKEKEIKDSLKKVKQQYDFLTKGFNNKRLVTSILKGSEFYEKELKKIRSASAKFFAVSMTFEVISMFSDSSDPILDAINDLSNKIDKLSKTTSLNFKYLKEFVEYTSYKKSFNYLKIEYEDILEVYLKVKKTDVWGQNPVSNLNLRNFTSDGYTNRISKAMVIISKLFKLKEQGVGSIIDSSIGNSDMLNRDCSYLISTLINLQALLLLARREAAFAYVNYSKKTDDYSLESYINSYDTTLDINIELYEEKFIDIITKTAEFQEYCLEEMNNYCLDYIDIKEIINESSISNEGIEKVAHDLKQQFPLHEFFCSIYTGVNGNSNHSIGPGDFKDSYISLRESIKDNKYNIVIYWWRSEEISYKERDKYTSINNSSKKSTSKININDVVEVESTHHLDKTIDDLLLNNYKSTELSRAISVYNCLIVNEEIAPRDYDSHEKEYYWMYDKNKILFATSENVDVEINCYYTKTSYESKAGTIYRRHNGIMLHAQPSEIIKYEF